MSPSTFCTYDIWCEKSSFLQNDTSQHPNETSRWQFLFWYDRWPALFQVTRHVLRQPFDPFDFFCVMLARARIWVSRNLGGSSTCPKRAESRDILIFPWVVIFIVSISQTIKTVQSKPHPTMMQVCDPHYKHRTPKGTRALIGSSGERWMDRCL